MTRGCQRGIFAGGQGARNIRGVTWAVAEGERESGAGLWWGGVHGRWNGDAFRSLRKRRGSLDATAAEYSLSLYFSLLSWLVGLFVFLSLSLE